MYIDHSLSKFPSQLVTGGTFEMLVTTKCKQECFSADRLWSDNPRQMLIPGVNRAAFTSVKDKFFSFCQMLFCPWLDKTESVCFGKTYVWGLLFFRICKLSTVYDLGFRLLERSPLAHLSSPVLTQLPPACFTVCAHFVSPSDRWPVCSVPKHLSLRLFSCPAFKHSLDDACSEDESYLLLTVWSGARHLTQGFSMPKF